jgi:tripartite-type tricarboxylate transporter receptor subunit TctC
MRKDHVKSGVAVLALALAGTLSTSAAGQDNFYKDKTVRIIVGFAPGGGFDTYARIIARHMGRHIPGNPTVIVENMTGAGSLIATNYVYKVAKPDGLTIGSISGSLILAQLLEQPGIEFDARKFEWLGMPTATNTVCAVTKASGIKTLADLAASKTPIKFGGTGRGTQPDDTVKVLKAALDLPMQLVSGYKGTSEARLAAEKGEVAGVCWDWESMRVTWRQAIESGEVNVIVQATAKPLPDLPKVALASSLAKTDEARKMIEVGVQTQATFTRPYILPTNTPKNRVQTLRTAFQATMKDPEFLADAAKSRLDINPVTAEEAESTVRDAFKIDPAVIRRLKEVMQ